MTGAVSIDLDALAGMPTQCIVALMKKRRAALKFFEEAQRAIQHHTALFLLFEELDIEPTFDSDMLTVRCCFSGDGPKLGKVWGELRRAGYNTEARPKKGDTEFSGWFNQEGYATVSIYFTSTLCRRVQVGTRTVEQPIYETICGEVLGEIPVEGARPPATAIEAPAEIPF